MDTRALCRVIIAEVGQRLVQWGVSALVVADGPLAAIPAVRCLGAAHACPRPAVPRRVVPAAAAAGGLAPRRGAGAPAADCRAGAAAEFLHHRVPRRGAGGGAGGSREPGRAWRACRYS